MLLSICGLQCNFPISGGPFKDLLKSITNTKCTKLNGTLLLRTVFVYIVNLDFMKLYEGNFFKLKRILMFNVAQRTLFWQLLVSGGDQSNRQCRLLGAKR